MSGVLIGRGHQDADTQQTTICTPRRTDPAHTVTVDSQPPRPGQNQSLLFNRVCVWVSEDRQRITDLKVTEVSISSSTSYQLCLESAPSLCVPVCKMGIISTSLQRCWRGK